MNGRASPVSERALAALRSAPLVLADHEAYGEILRREASLRRWAGDRFVLTGEYARLLTWGPPAPLTDGDGAAFTPRGYAVLLLVIAALREGSAQTLLSELAARVRALAADAGVPLNGDAYATRRDLVTALHVLRGWDVVSEADGELDAHLSDPRAEVLLDVRTGIAAALVTGRAAGASAPSELIEAVEGPR